MKAVIVNPGTHPELAHAGASLARASMLQRYFTGSMTTQDMRCIAINLAPAPIQDLAKQRMLPEGIQRRHLKRRGTLFEAARLITRGRSLRLHDTYMKQRTRRVDGAAAREIKQTRPDIVLGQFTGCMRSFQAAKSIGATTILNYSILHHGTLRNVLEAEAHTNPQWAFSMPELAETWDTAHYDAEIALADHLLVGSDTVKGSFVRAGIDSDKITVIPYGINSSFIKAHQSNKSRLEFCFVGQLTQRKGLFYLLEAFSRSPMLQEFARLSLIGPDVNGSAAFISKNYSSSNIKLLGTLSHDQVLNRMSRADVFILPSLAEGLALSALEAMSMGIPSILTTRVLGAIADSKCAYLVRSQNAHDLTTAMERMLTDSQLRESLATSSFNLARRLTWESYEKAISKFVIEIEDLRD